MNRQDILLRSNIGRIEQERKKSILSLLERVDSELVFDLIGGILDRNARNPLRAVADVLLVLTDLFSFSNFSGWVKSNFAMFLRAIDPNLLLIPDIDIILKAQQSLSGMIVFLRTFQTATGMIFATDKGEWRIGIVPGSGETFLTYIISISNGAPIFWSDTIPVYDFEDEIMGGFISYQTRGLVCTYLKEPNPRMLGSWKHYPIPKSKLYFPNLRAVVVDVENPKVPWMARHYREICYFFTNPGTSTGRLLNGPMIDTVSFMIPHDSDARVDHILAHYRLEAKRIGLLARNQLDTKINIPDRVEEIILSSGVSGNTFRSITRCKAKIVMTKHNKRTWVE